MKRSGRAPSPPGKGAPAGPPAPCAPDDGAAAFVLSLLAGGAAVPFPDEPDAAGRALRALRLHRLEGLAVARDREAAGPLLPAGARRELEPAYRARALHGTLLLESAGRAREALVGAGVPSLLFKGAALVRSGLYPDPGARAMDDVDLLVPADAARAAARALEGAGFEPWGELDPSRPGWLDSATFTEGASPRGIPLVVDLHWRTEYGGVRFGDPEGGSLLWRDAEIEAGLPAPEPHLVVVAEHLLKHIRFRYHLAACGDLARLARRVERWEAVVEAARERRLGAGVGLLLEAAARELGAPVPGEVVEALAGGMARGRRRRAYRALRPGANLEARAPVEGRLAGALLRWRLLGSWRRALADLREIAFPDGRWLRARYGAERGTTPRLWLRYAGDVLRWITGRGRSPASPNQDVI